MEESVQIVNEMDFNIRQWKKSCRFSLFSILSLGIAFRITLLHQLCRQFLQYLPIFPDLPQPTLSFHHDIKELQRHEIGRTLVPFLLFGIRASIKSLAENDPIFTAPERTPSSLRLLEIDVDQNLRIPPHSRNDRRII